MTSASAWWSASPVRLGDVDERLKDVVANHRFLDVSRVGEVCDEICVGAKQLLVAFPQAFVFMAHQQNRSEAFGTFGTLKCFEVLKEGDV